MIAFSGPLFRHGDRAPSSVMGPSRLSFVPAQSVWATLWGNAHFVSATEAEVKAARQIEDTALKQSHALYERKHFGCGKIALSMGTLIGIYVCYLIPLSRGNSESGVCLKSSQSPPSIFRVHDRRPSPVHTVHASKTPLRGQPLEFPLAPNYSSVFITGCALGLLAYCPR